MAGSCGGQRARKGQGFSGRPRTWAAADRGVPSMRESMHRVTASQMRSSLILIERPSREEPDRADSPSASVLGPATAARGALSRFLAVSKRQGQDSVRNPPTSTNAPVCGGGGGTTASLARSLHHCMSSWRECERQLRRAAVPARRHRTSHHAELIAQVAVRPAAPSVADLRAAGLPSRPAGAAC